MDPREMDPSAIRERILDDHATIRVTLDTLTRLSLKLRDEPSVAGELRELLRRFLPELRAHMKREDDLLVPALEEADAFGDVRTKVVADHHSADRDMLAKLEADLEGDGLAGDALRAAVARLVAGLHQEMAVEERDLLHPDILRDDFISIGHQGG